MLASDFRKVARTGLKGKWGIAILASLLSALLGGDGSIITLRFRFSENGYEIIDSKIGSCGFDWNFNIHNILYNIDWRIVGIIVTVLMIIGIIQVIIGGAFELGLCKFNMNLVDGTNARFEDIFSQFRIFGKAFCMRLLIYIYTFLWTLLFVIPGIVKAYAYRMTPYIILDNPDVSANDAIKESQRMMRGNKFRLFCLDLSFIGWNILCTLSLGIGFIWLKPYKIASITAFYNDVSGRYDTGYYAI